MINFDPEYFYSEAFSSPKKDNVNFGKVYHSNNNDGDWKISFQSPHSSCAELLLKKPGQEGDYTHIGIFANASEAMLAASLLGNTDKAISLFRDTQGVLNSNKESHSPFSVITSPSEISVHYKNAITSSGDDHVATIYRHNPIILDVIGNIVCLEIMNFRTRRGPDHYTDPMQYFEFENWKKKIYNSQ